MESLDSFQKLMLKKKGFFITGSKGDNYKGTKYGKFVMVWKHGGCQPAKLTERAMWRELKKQVEQSANRIVSGK